MSTSIYFLYGEEGFLLEERLAALREQYAGATVTAFSDTFSLDDVLQEATTVDMFAATKLILLENPFFLFKSLEKADVAKLTMVLEAFSGASNGLVIFLRGKSLDKRKKGFSLLKKHAQVEEFVSFKDWEQDKVLWWIGNRVKAFDLSIDRDAVLALEQVGGVNLRHIAAEIDKLRVYIGDRKQIGVADVYAVTGGGNASIFQFNEAMKVRDLPKMLRLATRLLDNGEDPIRLMGMLTSNVRFYYQLLSLSAARQSPQQMGKVLGKNPYFVQKVLPAVKQRYSLAFLTGCFSKLASADLNIKTGKIAPRLAVESVLMGFSDSAMGVAR